MPASLDFLFFIPSNHGDRIAESSYCEEHPLGGSETSVVRLAGALGRLGHRVRIVTDPSALQGMRAGIFIASRDWRPLSEGWVDAPLRYYWAHDDIDQPHIAPLHEPAQAARLYASCQAVAVLSQYQFFRWAQAAHLPAEKAFFTRNGVEAGSVIGPDEIGSRPPRCYYALTPGRGLRLLLEQWPQIKGAVPAAELWVFGSSAIYNETERPEYEALYELARSLPGVATFGAVGQRPLREAARQCRVLSYPCTFPETSCIVAMEAMAAGCAVVAPVLGALAETAWRNPLIWPHENWIDAWTLEVCRVLADSEYYRDVALQNIALASTLSYDRLARDWLRRIRLDELRLRAG